MASIIKVAERPASDKDSKRGWGRGGRRGRAEPRPDSSSGLTAAAERRTGKTQGSAVKGHQRV